MREPLAARMRPRTLDEYIGQDHIVGKGRLLRRAIAADRLSSVIFYGPPGSGKTTLARVIANHTKSSFITLNAVLTGVADIRAAIKSAEEHFNLYSRRTILFVDEVHRWNKAQQDALLPWVENGTIILIGATTENPFFEVNKALVSRSRVFQLKALTSEDLEKAARQALGDAERGYGRWNVEFEKGALEHLVETANGDARSLLNALELAVETTPEKWSPESNPPVPAWGSTIYISRETAEESIQKKVVLYDRDGDYHYDIISAFIKSLRGRDPDAAMYWLARMVAAGEDADFIFRRMLISSCEDTGLADPNAVTVVSSCAAAFDRVGMPEGRYFLAHAALYLATAPKSNSSMAFFDALSSVEKEDADIPNHLRDGSRDAEGFGHGAGYLYPHAYRDHWVAQQYLPDALVGRVFYTPSAQGYEKTIRDEVMSRRETQIAAILVETAAGGKSKADPSGAWYMGHFNGTEKTGEQLTFSPADKAKENALDRADKSWRARLDSNRAELLLRARDEMLGMARLSRHHRCLVWDADDGLLLWECARRTPEGAVCGVCRTQKGKEILEQYARTLSDIDKPKLLLRGGDERADFLSSESFRDALARFQYDGIVFDRIFFRNPFVSKDSIDALAEALRDSASGRKRAGFAFTDSGGGEDDGREIESPLADGFAVVISQRVPSSAQHVSRLVERQILSPSSRSAYSAALEKMESAEKEFFGDKSNPLFAWNAESAADAFRARGFDVESVSRVQAEKRRLSPDELRKWFDTGASAYGAAMARSMGEADLQKIVRLLESASGNTIFDWESETAFLTVKAKR